MEIFPALPFKTWSYRSTISGSPRAIYNDLKSCCRSLTPNRSFLWAQKLEVVVRSWLLVGFSWAEAYRLWDNCPGGGAAVRRGFSAMEGSARQQMMWRDGEVRMFLTMDHYIVIAICYNYNMGELWVLLNSWIYWRFSGPLYTEGMRSCKQRV